MEKSRIRVHPVNHRKPFQGVLNILDFNRHFYYGALAFVVLLLIVAYFLSWPQEYIFYSIGLIVLGLTMPLLVSAYVYDFSGFYRFRWLKRILGERKVPYKVLNFNAGFDESSATIAYFLPESDLQVYDFYDEEQHTEAAIVRARRAGFRHPGTLTVKTDFIPHDEDSVDLLCFISSLHEVRDASERIAFLEEVRRVLAPEGRVILVEHLRDLPNFLAFSIGFFHFFSHRTWMQDFSRAGLYLDSRRRFTPFLNIYTFYHDHTS